MDKYSINIDIAERSYPLIVREQEEEKIKKAVGMINERFELYKSKYGNKDTQDLLAMCSLQLVTKLIELTEKQTEDFLYENVKKIDEELGNYIYNL